MSKNDRIKLIAADTLARLVVYGPLVALAVMFCPPAIVVLGLAASQPWLGQGLAKAGTYLEKKFPRLMAPINSALSRYVGMPWWKHAGVLLTALAVAVIPTPGIAEHLPGPAKSVLDFIGGTDSLWTQQVLPFALVTALPFATKLAEHGFEWVFQKIPFLRDASIQRQDVRKDRVIEREALRARMRGIETPDASPGLTRDVSTSPAMIEDVPTAAPQSRLDGRRVRVTSRLIVQPQTKLLFPEVICIASPPRVILPQVRSTAGYDGLG